MADFFGFEIKRKGGEEPIRPSFVPNTDEDGSGVIQAGGHFGAYLDLDGDKAKNEIDLILKYRDVATQPECDAAVEDIINEAIVGDKIECDNCDWSWDISSGGNDLFVCHKCGHDNEPTPVHPLQEEAQLLADGLAKLINEGIK